MEHLQTSHIPVPTMIILQPHSRLEGFAVDLSASSIGTLRRAGYSGIHPISNIIRRWVVKGGKALAYCFLFWWTGPRLHPFGELEDYYLTSSKERAVEASWMRVEVGSVNWYASVGAIGTARWTYISSNPNLEALDGSVYEKFSHTLPNHETTQK